MQILHGDTRARPILGRLREKFRGGFGEKRLRLVMAVAILSRLYVFTVAVVSNLAFGMNPACTTTLKCWNINLPFVILFSRWDSGFYADIAATGYSNSIIGRWEFFPLYPSAMGVLGRTIADVSGMQINLAVNLAGFIVSNLTFLASVFLLYRTSQRILGDVEAAADSAVLLAIYPAGVFLSAVYSEALFLCLTLGSLHFWYLGKRGRAGIFGLLATLTRPVGALLAVPYLYDSVTTKSIRCSLRTYLSVATIVLGLVGFAVYSELMTRTPFATFSAEQSFWHVTLDPVYISTLALNEIHDHPVIIPYLVIAIAGIAVSFLTTRSRVEREIGLYSLCLLASYLIVPIISFPRYSITLIPMYWGLARLTHRGWARALVYACFLLLLAVGTGLFVNWYSFY